MQEIASEFSNGCPLLASVRFRWLEAASGPSQREEATPSLTQHPARLGRGAQAPRCGPKPWSPLNFSAMVAPLILVSTEWYQFAVDYLFSVI